MSKQEILQTDRWWIANVYFRPRDKDGQLRIAPKSEGVRMNYRQQFFHHWRQYGLPDWRIEQLFNQKLEEQQKQNATVNARMARMRRGVGVGK